MRDMRHFLYLDDHANGGELGGIRVIPGEKENLKRKKRGFPVGFSVRKHKIFVDEPRVTQYSTRHWSRRCRKSEFTYRGFL